MAHDLQHFAERGRAIESEFSAMFGTPSYVVRLSESSLSPCRASEHGFNGMASPFMSQLFRGDVPRVKQAGPCILLDDIAFATMHPHSVKEALHEFTAIAVHEIGHIANETIPFAPDWFEMEPTQSTRFVERVEQPDRHFAGVEVSWRDQHDASWIRHMIHVGRRLQHRGYAIHWRMCAGMRNYGYSPLINYVEALGDEPDELIHVPITKIKHVPPPAEFLQQWERDLKEWPDV